MHSNSRRQCTGIINLLLFCNKERRFVVRSPSVLQNTADVSQEGKWWKKPCCSQHCVSSLEQGVWRPACPQQTIHPVTSPLAWLLSCQNITVQRQQSWSEWVVSGMCWYCYIIIPQHHQPATALNHQHRWSGSLQRHCQLQIFMFSGDQSRV